MSEWIEVTMLTNAEKFEFVAFTEEIDEFPDPMPDYPLVQTDKTYIVGSHDVQSLSTTKKYQYQIPANTNTIVWYLSNTAKETVLSVDKYFPPPSPWDETYHTLYTSTTGIQFLTTATYPHYKGVKIDVSSLSIGDKVKITLSQNDLSYFYITEHLETVDELPSNPIFANEFVASVAYTGYNLDLSSPHEYVYTIQNENSKSIAMGISNTSGENVVSVEFI